MATAQNLAEAIPPELKTHPQWVCWRIEQRDGKPTKVPMTLDGKRAAVDKPDTWCTFSEAIAAAQQYQFAGVGFVFTTEDPYTGVDLDKCINLKTEEVADWAQNVIDRLGSYTELSQSRTGVHILIKAKLPEGRRRKGGTEMYDNGRFFIMTGDHFQGTPTTIESRQTEIEALHKELFPPTETHQYSTSHDLVTLDDQALLDKMLTRNNIRQLWEGNINGYPSQSEADQALCNHLAFWTQREASRMDWVSFTESSPCIWSRRQAIRKSQLALAR